MNAKQTMTEDELAQIILNKARPLLNELAGLNEALERRLTRLVGHEVPIDHQKLNMELLRTKNEIMGAEIGGKLVAEWMGIGEAVEMLRTPGAVFEQDGAEEKQDTGNVK